MFTKVDQHINKGNNSLFNQGNSSGFLQPKLNVGKPGDKYEIEADRAADSILAKSKANPSAFVAPSPNIQKQTEEDVQQKENEQEIQQKPVVDKITPGVQLKSEKDEEVQTKCADCEKETVQKKDTSADSETEEEIQQVSEEETVQTQKDEQIQESKQTELAPIQKSSSEEEVQSKEEEEIQEKEEEETVQKQSTSGGTDGSNIESQLSNSKGGGSPLDAETKGEMESGFGADFSGVRVHNDSNAVHMNQELGSQAFTNGNDIYFNEGKYNPSSDSGKHLLAHELTHTVQQGASPNNSVQQKEDKTTKNESGKPTSPLDISQRFALNDEWATYLDGLYSKGERIFEVDVKIGNRYKGTIKVTKQRSTETGKKAKYELHKKGLDRYLEISGWNFMDPLRSSGVTPILVLNNFGDSQATTGFLSVKMKGAPLLTDSLGFIKGLNSNLEKMNMHGVSTINVNTDGLQNKFEQGKLNFQINALSTTIAGYIQAGGGIGIVNDGFTINFIGKVDVSGVASGELNVKRKEDGKLDGSVEIDANIANVNAKIKVEYIKGDVTMQGTGRIQSEKFSGELTLLVTDEAKSKQMMHAGLGVQTLEGDKNKAKTPDPSKKVKKTPKNQVLVGWGTVEATITPWLQGKASVGLDHKGQVTIVGSISVPDEVRLMEQKGKKQDLFDVQIKAGYGIPLVGQVFLFAGVGMFVNAGFGPIVLKNVGFTGTYSTDPAVLQNFSITGTLGINAFALLGLKIEAGVGVTLLGHDIKAGISGTAAAGIQAYAEATPTFEYKEKKNPTGGKVGESRLKGNFEAAAQVFLQLGGSLFYELDSPWWSPAPDGRTDHPLGEVQYPLDQMGIGADVDWLVGSEKPPELKFKPVKFDPGKFTSDMMADPPKKKQGESQAKPKGKFDDKSGGGDKQKDPKLNKDGKGTPNTKKQDPKKLSDDKKYLQGLNELSKLEKANPKPSIGVVKAKMQQVKSKYGLEAVNIKKKKDGEVSIYIKHKKQNNGKHLLNIKLMSNTERMKLLTAAMVDLRKREEKIVDKKGTTEEAKAKDMILAWTKVHPIIESAKVVDGKTTWDYFIDVGDKKNTETGKQKSGVQADGKVDQNNLSGGGKKVLDTILKMEVPFTNKSKEKHKLDFELKGSKIVLFRKSIPQDIENQIQALKDAVSNEKGKTEEAKVGATVLAKVKEAWEAIEVILINDITPLFKRMKKVEGQPDKEVSDNSFAIKKGEAIKQHLNAIAGVLDDVPEIVEGKFKKESKQIRPQSEVKFHPTVERPLAGADGKTTKDATKMTAKLSRVGPSNTVGSQPNSAGHSELYRDLIDNGVDVVAAHLLNHQLFGRGNNVDNLTPFPKLLNNPTMETNIENRVKKAVLEQNKVVFYEVTVNYKNSRQPKITENDKLLPDSITAEAYELKTADTITDEQKADVDYWKVKGDDIKTDPVEVTEASIQPKKTSSEIDRMDLLLGKIDEFLSKTPEGTWWDFSRPKTQEFQKLIGGTGTNYSGHPLFESLKKEFFKKKEKLNESFTPNEPTTMVEFIMVGKKHLRDLNALINDGVVNKGGLSEVVNSKQNSIYVGIRFINTALKANDDADAKQAIIDNISSISIRKDLEKFYKNLTDFTGRSNDDIKGAFLQGIKAEVIDFVMKIRLLSNKTKSSPTSETYEALRKFIKDWNDIFNTTSADDLQKDLNEIYHGGPNVTLGVHAFLADNDAIDEQKLLLGKVYEGAKTRLKLKQGDEESSFQKIIRQMKLDQDNIETYQADPQNGQQQITKILTSDPESYIMWRLGLELDKLGLNNDKIQSINQLYGKLQEAAKSTPDSTNTN